jgi:DNA invertase Pin-like site-specific DNA recombinase
MNVYSYARISTDMQSESSIDDQHHICRDYAKSRAGSSQPSLKTSGSAAPHSAIGPARAKRSM